MAIKQDHRVMVETNAGNGVSDAEYARPGMEIIDTAAELFDFAEKVKRMKPGSNRVTHFIAFEG